MTTSDKDRMMDTRDCTCDSASVRDASPRMHAFTNSVVTWFSFLCESERMRKPGPAQRIGIAHARAKRGGVNVVRAPGIAGDASMSVVPVAVADPQHIAGLRFGDRQTRGGGGKGIKPCRSGWSRKVVITVRRSLASTGISGRSRPKCSRWMARNRPQQSNAFGPRAPACQGRPMYSAAQWGVGLIGSSPGRSWRCS